MRASKEVSIELLAEDLLAPLPSAAAKVATGEPAYDDTVEIELTAEEIDAMLSAGSPPARG